MGKSQSAEKTHGNCYWENQGKILIPIHDKQRQIFWTCVKDGTEFIYKKSSNAATICSIFVCE